ncbi:MAG: NUDIX hydrolase [Clostridium sp.]|uniref:NUDIX hydrolase n=1 Tax=Clostridium sp. TaxID=1506 RepID=UPI003D6D6695
MYLVSNMWGYNLVQFISMSEQDLKSKRYNPITGSLIVVDCDEKILIGYNTRRKQWELPAGGIEMGESPRDCAIRELYEETNQSVDNARFIGLVKLYDSNTELMDYQALYYTVIDKLESFSENEEMNEIKLWDLKDEIEEFDTVEREILNICLNVINDN